MSLLPDVANPYMTALAGGFIYGIAFCTSTCLPYVAGYIAGINAGFRKGVAITLIFNSGRITAYAIIGAVIGTFNYIFSGGFLLVFQAYSSVAFSIVTIVIGASLLAKGKKPICNLMYHQNEEKSASELGNRFDFRAYTLGLSRGLVICAPLMALLAYSLAFSSPLDSVFIAVLFGIGTAISPILLVGGATGWLLNKAPLYRKWISRFGAAALIVLGVLTLIDATII